MAEIQHQDARKLLDIISSALENGNRLTYWEAATPIIRNILVATLTGQMFLKGVTLLDPISRY